MNSTLYNGYSGIKTHQFGLDSVSNNIANINTNGYRANMPEFKSLFASALNSTNPYSPVSSDMNYGSSAASNAISNAAGNYIESEGELNVAYAGRGWLVVGDSEENAFNVQEPNSHAYFTRDGSFSRDGEGYIVNTSGYYMLGIDLGKIKDGVFISNPNDDAINLASAELTPIRIPQDLHYGPTETTRVNIAVNLNNNQGVLSTFELFKDANGAIDEERILTLDMNSLLANNKNINANAYNDATILINSSAREANLSFVYGEDFRTLGEFIERLRESGLEVALSRDSSGNIDKSITLEIRNASLNDMEVTLGGKLFSQLGMSGTKNLASIDVAAFNSNKQYNPNDLVKISGAIFKRIESSGNSSPLEDLNSWILLDGTGVEEFDESKTYAPNSLVKNNNQIFRKLDSSEDSNNSLQNPESWAFFGNNETFEIEQFTQGAQYSRNSFVYYNGHIYQKISDEMSRDPANEPLNWKIANAVSFLSDRLNVANYKTTTEFFDDNGDKMLIISEFILRENSQDAQIWDVKSAIYDRDGNNIISDVLEHEISFDSEGNATSEPITLQYGDKSFTYNIGGGDTRNSTNYAYLDSSVQETSKDGTQKGELVNIGVDNNGIIQLSFSNGITESMGRVGVVAFVNDQGLQKVGSNLFEMTSLSVDGGESAIASGAPILGWDEVGNLRFGQILHKYLETSNVNAANAMTDLIVYQRGYAMNAKAFTTGDDLIKEAINLKR